MDIDDILDIDLVDDDWKNLLIINFFLETYVKKNFAVSP